jgi:hypothetical protein
MDGSLNTESAPFGPSAALPDPAPVLLAGCAIPRVINVPRSVFRRIAQASAQRSGPVASAVEPVTLGHAPLARQRIIMEWLHKTETAAKRLGLLAPVLLLPLAAQAQEIGYTAVEQIDGVASYTLRADGALELVFTTGARVVIAASNVQVDGDGDIYIAEEALEGLPVVSGPALELDALAVFAGGALLAGIAAGGGSGSAPEDRIGLVIDGYVDGAVVYRDLNGNGLRDPGEPFTETNANGEFSFRALPGSGTLRASGGIDVATGEAFLGEMSAPSSATVITPLTTLVQQYVLLNEGTAGRAADIVAETLGLTGADLLNDDPVRLALDGSVEQLRTAAKVANVMQLVSAADGNQAAAIAELLDGLLADAAALSNADVLKSVFDAALPGSPDVAQNLADATALANAALEAATLNEIVAVQFVVQRELSGQAKSVGEIDVDLIAEAIEEAFDLVSDGAVRTDFVRLFIVDDAPAATNQPVTFTFTFSEAVTGFTADLISVSNGTKGDFTEVEEGTSFTLVVTPPPEAEGIISVSVAANAVQSVDGDRGNQAAAKQQAFDTLAPDAPVVSLATDSGISDEDAITNDATLTITAEPGSTVRVFDGDTLLGDATEGAPGEFTFTPTGLEDGTYTLTATATDAAGNVSEAGEIEFTLDTTAPDAPGVSLATDSGASNEDALTNDATLTITAEPGSTVRVFDGDTLLGDATEGAEGEFTFTPTGLEDGTYTLTATATDAAGNLSEAGEIEFTLDTTAPDAPGVSLATDSGISDEDALTNDATLTITAEAGSTVRVFDGDTLLGDATEGAEGEFTFTPTGLEDGTYTLTATATDAAGNLSEAGEIEFTLDTTAPDAPVVSLATDSGISDEDALTNDATLTITAEAGSTVRVFDGDNELGVATEGAEGEFTFTPTGLADGTYTLTATATDAAGNLSEAGEIEFTLDTATATPVHLHPVSLSESGEIEFTHDTTPALSCRRGRADQ